MQRTQRILAALLALGMAATAQAAHAETLRMGGAGIVLGLMHRLAEPFSRYSPGDTLEIVPGLGTAGALTATSKGALDITFSGRSLNPAEIAAGMQFIPFLETPFVFVSDTPQVLRLTRKDIVSIYSGESFHYPDGSPARLVIRPRNDTSTGLLIAMIDGMGEALDRARKRSDIPVASHDQHNMETARQMKGAFAGMTLTQLSTEPNSLRHVIVDGVEPTLVAMQAQTYPFKQKIYFAYRSGPSHAAQRFFAFLKTPEAKALITEAGGHPLR